MKISKMEEELKIANETDSWLMIETQAVMNVEIERLERSQKDLENTLTEYNKERTDKLRNQCEALERQSSIEKQKNDELKISNIVKEFTMKISKMEEELEAANETESFYVKEMQAAMKVETERLANTKKDLEETQKELVEAHEKQMWLQGQIEDLNTELERSYTEEKKLREQSAKSQQQEQKTCEKQLSLQKHVELLQTQLEVMNAEVERSCSEARYLKEQRAHAQKQVVESNEKQLDLQNQLDVINAEVERLYMEEKNLKAQRERAQKELNESNEKKLDLQKQVDEIKMQIEDMMRSMADMEEQQKKSSSLADTELEKLREHNKELTQECEKLKKETSDLPVVVALKYDVDFDETLSSPEATAKFDAHVQEQVGTALGIPSASVHVLCHQRGSVIAEVLLKRVDMKGGDGDSRNPALLAQELVEMTKDRNEALCRREFGDLAVTSVKIDGPMSVCDLVKELNKLHGTENTLNQTLFESKLSLDVVKIRVADLEKQLENEKQEKDESLNAANGHVAELEKQLEELEKQLEDVREVLKGHSKVQQKEFEIQKQEMQAKISKMEEELKGSNEAAQGLRELQQEYALDKQTKEELRAKLLKIEDELAAQRAQAPKELNESFGDVLELKQQLEEEKNDIRTLFFGHMERLNTAETYIDAMIKAISDCAQVFEGMKAKNLGQLLHLNSQLTDLQNTTNDFSAKHLREKEEMRIKISKLEGDLSVLQLDLETLRGDRDDFVRRLALAEEKGSNFHLDRAIELTRLAREVVAKEHWRDHASPTKVTANVTTIGMSFDDHTAVIKNVLVGGPAFHSQKIFKNDIIVSIDGKAVNPRDINQRLRGMDVPGSAVTVGLRKPSGLVEEVKLLRMASAKLADKIKTLEIFTKLICSAKEKHDEETHQYVEQALELWTAGLVEVFEHDEVICRNIHKMQNTADIWFQELLQILEGEVGKVTNEQPKATRAASQRTPAPIAGDELKAGLDESNEKSEKDRLKMVQRDLDESNEMQLKLRTQLDAMKTELGKAHWDLDEANELQLNLQKQLDAMNTEIRNEALEEAHKEKEHLKKHLEDMTMTMNEKEEQLSRAHKELDEIKAERSRSLATPLPQTHEEENTLKKRKEEAPEEAHKEKWHLKKQLEDMTSIMNEKEEQLRRAQKELDEIKMERSRSLATLLPQKDLDESNEMQLNPQKQLDAMNTQVSETHEEKNTLKKRNEEALEVAHKENEHLKKQLEDMTSTTKEKEEQLRRRIGQLQTNLSGLEEELAKSKLHTNLQLEGIHKAQEENKILKIEFTALERELKDTQTALAMDETELKKDKEILLQDRKELASKETEIATLKTQLKALEDQTAKQQRATLDVQAKHLRAVETVVALQKSLDESNQDKIKLDSVEANNKEFKESLLESDEQERKELDEVKEEHLRSLATPLPQTHEEENTLKKRKEEAPEEAHKEKEHVKKQLEDMTSIMNEKEVQLRGAQKELDENKAERSKSLATPLPQKDLDESNEMQLNLQKQFDSMSGDQGGKREQAKAIENAPVQIIMTLGLDFSTAGSEGSDKREQVMRDVSEDLDGASGLPPGIKDVSPGSIILDMEVMPDPLVPGMQILTAKDLPEQAGDPSSQLRSGKITSHTAGVQVLPPAPVADVDELNKCRADLQTCREEIGTCQRELQAREKYVKEMEERVKTLDAKLAESRLAKEQISIIEKESQSWTQEKEELIQKILKVEDEFKVKISSASDENAKIAKELLDLRAYQRTSLNAANAHVADLEAHVADLQKRLQHVWEVLKGQSKVQQHESEIQTQQKDELKPKILKMEEKLKGANETVEQQKKSSSLADTELEKLREHNKELTQECEKLKKETSDLPVVVALKYDVDFDETLSSPEATAKFDAHVQEQVGTALGIPSASVHVLCHQRGSVIAEVLLKRVDMKGGDGDSRNPALLAQELVEMTKDRNEALCRREFGDLAVTSVKIDGPMSEPIFDLFKQTLNEARKSSVEFGKQLRNKEKEIEMLEGLKKHRDMELDASYEETRQLKQQLEEIANNMAETKEKLQKSQKALGESIELKRVMDERMGNLSHEFEENVKKKYEEIAQLKSLEESAAKAEKLESENTLLEVELDALTHSYDAMKNRAHTAEEEVREIREFLEELNEQKKTLNDYETLLVEGHKKAVNESEERIKLLEAQNEVLKHSIVEQEHMLHVAMVREQERVKREHELQKLIAKLETEVYDLVGASKNVKSQPQNGEVDTALQREICNALLAHIYDINIEWQLCIRQMSQEMQQREYYYDGACFAEHIGILEQKCKEFENFHFEFCPRVVNGVQEKKNQVDRLEIELAQLSHAAELASVNQKRAEELAVRERHSLEEEIKRLQQHIQNQQDQKRAEGLADSEKHCLEEEIKRLQQHTQNQQTNGQDFARALAVRDQEIKAVRTELRTKERQMMFLTTNNISSVAADLAIYNQDSEGDFEGFLDHRSISSMQSVGNIRLVPQHSNPLENIELKMMGMDNGYETDGANTKFQIEPASRGPLPSNSAQDITPHPPLRSSSALSFSSSDSSVSTRISKLASLADAQNLPSRYDVAHASRNIRGSKNIDVFPAPSAPPPRTPGYAGKTLAEDTLLSPLQPMGAAYVGVFTPSHAVSASKNNPSPRDDRRASPPESATAIMLQAARDFVNMDPQAQKLLMASSHEGNRNSLRNSGLVSSTLPTIFPAPAHDNRQNDRRSLRDLVDASKQAEEARAAIKDLMSNSKRRAWPESRETQAQVNQHKNWFEGQ